MFERTQSFDMNGQSYKEIQKKIENILQNNLMYSIDTIRLGESLLRINYYDGITEREAQKSNRITILREPWKKIYIQIRGQLTDIQIGRLWKELDKDLRVASDIDTTEVKTITKDEIILRIMELIKLRGYIIDKNDAQHFLEKFQAKYKRLPKNEEIQSISKGYTIMVNEDYFNEKASAPHKTEPLSEEINIDSEEMDNRSNTDSYNHTKDIIKTTIGRRQCPSCGDKGSIREVTDKTVIIMDYPRIYGKKKHCSRCAYEWRK